MSIWSAEIKELEKLYESFKGQLPELEKELEQLIHFDDPNVILLYSRRCLEVIITDLCECELKRPRKTEPLKGIIDKLNKEEKVPSNIITSMDHLNSLSAYGAHPKDFDPEQVKPVLNNLDIIIKWYLKYKDFQITGKSEPEKIKYETKPLEIFPPEKSIIVLPFENISPDPDQEYFSDGLTEEIITDLSHIHDLLVISRSSAMTFKGIKKTIPEIAQAVKVRYVLEGSVRKAGNNLKITAQLIDSVTDAHLWAEKYTSVLDDIFDIQEKVSRSIVDTLKIKLSTEEKQKIAQQSIDNIKAHECYLRANNELLKFTQDSLDLARQYLQEGLKLVGDNALIYSALGTVYYYYYDCGFNIETDPIQRARELAKRAYKLNPDLASVHFLFGLLERGTGNLKKAVGNIKYAFKIDPNNASILLMYVWALSLYIGKPYIGQPLIKKLVEIDPYTPFNYVAHGILCWMNTDNEKAKALFQKALKMDSKSRFAYFWYANFLARNGYLSEFLNIIDHIQNDDSTDMIAQFMMFFKYAIKQDREKALGLITDKLRTFIWNDPECPWIMAGLFSILNEKELSLDWLEHAVDRGWINYPLFITNDPFLENIRGEERFKKLMERVKYEWENFEV